MRGSAALCILLLQCAVVSGQASWSLKFNTGLVYNFKTPLVIRQAGSPDIRINAIYESESLVFPIYYNYGFSRWKDSTAWGAAFTHHKLYLKNTTNEIQQLSISHGYNFLTVNRSWMKKWFIVRVGGGVIIAHAESTIRNLKFNDEQGWLNKGYYLAGPILDLAVAKRFYLWRQLYFSTEVRCTVGWARLPVHSGTADVTNLAVHGLVGLGYNFNMKEK